MSLNEPSNLKGNKRPQYALNHPEGDFVRYHIRNGKHDVTLYDWQQYLQFADDKLKNE